MACKKCQEYLLDYLNISPNGLKEIFDTEITLSSGAWCSGKGICKTCGQKVKFEFENFTYNKMRVFIQTGT